MATHPQPTQPGHPGPLHPPGTPQKPPIKKRKVIQIAVNTAGNGSILALCDDGTLWVFTDSTITWAQIDTSVVDDAPAMPDTYTGATPPTIPATAGAVGAATPTH